MRVIPKSGYRFSDKITRQKEAIPLRKVVVRHCNGSTGILPQCH
jgi:hypothetical protein